MISQLAKIGKNKVGKINFENLPIQCKKNTPFFRTNILNRIIFFKKKLGAKTTKFNRVS